MKTEPDSFSIQDLAASPRQTTGWEGVRNYQARNFLKEMHIGDRVLVYHSGADPLAVVGVAMVVHEAYPDSTAWDPLDQHFDPKSSPKDPIWEMVDLRLEEIFPQPSHARRAAQSPGAVENGTLPQRLAALRPAGDGEGIRDDHEAHSRGRATPRCQKEEREEGGAQAGPRFSITLMQTTH